MLGVSSNGKWSHNIVSQSTGGSGRGRGASRRKSEAGVISLVSIERASQAFSKSSSFTPKSTCLCFFLSFSHSFYKDVFHWDISLIAKPYKSNLLEDLALASPTRSFCREIPISITVNQETGVKHTHSGNFNQSYFIFIVADNTALQLANPIF